MALTFARVEVVVSSPSKRTPILDLHIEIIRFSVEFLVSSLASELRPILSRDNPVSLPVLFQSEIVGGSLLIPGRELPRASSRYLPCLLSLGVLRLRFSRIPSKPIPVSFLVPRRNLVNFREQAFVRNITHFIQSSL